MAFFFFADSGRSELICCFRQARKEDAVLEQQHVKAQTKEPHFVNLNEDPMLSGVIHHPIMKGKVTLIGRKDADPAPHIVLTGLRYFS